MRPLLILLLLAACDSPTPMVAGWHRATVDEGGMTFGVLWARDRAEAYRTSKHWLPHRSEVMANAKAAIERVSGCRVKEGSLEGDAAIVKARLAC